MKVQIIITRGDGSMFSHLKSRTVLTGIAAAALGLFYQLEDFGVLPMYVDATTITRLTTVAGMLVYYFRVTAKATIGADGRVTPADIERIKAEARDEVLSKLRVEGSK